MKKDNIKKKNKLAGKIAAAIIFFAAVIFYFYSNIISDNSSAVAVFAETDTKFDFNYEDKADIYSFAGKGFFLTTRDGMSYYTADKEIKWAESYSVSMKEPIMFGEGQYVGVCDVNGQAFYMFSSSGLLYSKNYENKILSFSVSSGGYASVICKNGQEYTVQAFDPKGEEINCYYCRNDNVFPVASDISGDGRMLAISVADINSTVLVSKLMVLYNNADEKQSYLNGVFYQTSRDNELIAGVEFLQDNQLLFLSDQSLTCLITETSGYMGAREKWSMPLDNEIDSITVGAGKIIAVAYGKPIPGRDSKPAGMVELYNLDLNKIGEYEFSGRVSFLASSGEYIIAGSGRKYAAFNNKGKCIWEYGASSDVKKLAVLENQNTVLALDNLRAQVIRKQR